MLEDGELWHRTSQSERHGVVIDLVMPHGPGSTAGHPRWRLVIHDQPVTLPETFSTWTVLDLMAAVQEAAVALEALPWAPEDSGDFDALTAPAGPEGTRPRGLEEDA
jgi:hypothetical protein